MDRRMENLVLDEIVTDIEAEVELETDAHQVLVQFLASVCSERYVCPPICVLAEKLKRHSLFLVFDCLILAKNKMVSEEEKSVILSWLRSKQFSLQLADDAEIDDDEDDFSDSLNDYSSWNTDLIELRQQMKTLEIENRFLLDDITYLEGELKRIRGF